MRLAQALLISFATGAMVLTLETALVVVLSGAHALIFLRNGTTPFTLWLLYILSFLVPGGIAWAGMKLATRGRVPRYPAALPLVTALMTVALFNTLITIRPVAGRLLTAPPILLGVVLGLVILTFLLVRRGLRGDYRWHKTVAALLLLGIAGLTVVCQFIAHRLAAQLISPAGVRELLVALGGGLLFAVPLVAAVWRGRSSWLATSGLLYVLAFAVLLFMPVAAPGTSPAPSADDESLQRPSVLLIVIDALRADAVDTSAEAMRRAPHLTGFRSEAIDFPHAYAAAPWTGASFGSILTATYPSRHHCAEREPVHHFKSPLDSSVPTLAEALSENGYWTGAVVTNGYLSNRFGLNRGFDAYRNLLSIQDNHPLLQGLIHRGLYATRSHPYVIGRDQNSRILGMIDAAQPAERPFFILAHYMDPHVPYQAPEHFPHGPESVSTLHDQYLAEVTYCDHYVGLLLDELRGRKLLEDLLVIITADHGEEFYEGRIPTDHGGRAHDHGHTLFDELLHVPLMVKLPGGVAAGTVREDHVSLVDIGPTILALLGVDPPDTFLGRSLLTPPAASQKRHLFAEGMLFGSEQKAIMEGPHKLILSPAEPEPANASIYRRDEDPGEVSPVPLEDARPAEQELFAALLKFMSGYTASSDTVRVEMDPNLRRQLRSLGYID